MTRRAWIITLKKSKKRMGYYYPVFEYTDEDGMIRNFTSSVCREITPFAFCRPYRLKKIGFSVYEKEELKVAPRFYWTILAVALTIVSLFGLRAMLCSLCLATLALSMDRLVKLVKNDRMQKFTYQNAPIEGKIIGCQRRRYRHIDGVIEEQFYPVVEYEYQGEIYQHVSSRQDDPKAAVGKACNIYINVKNKRVFDKYEADIPIKDIVLPKIYIPKFKRPVEEKKNPQAQYKISKNAPPLALRTHDVSPGRKKRSA